MQACAGVLCRSHACLTLCQPSAFGVASTTVWTMSYLQAVIEVSCASNVQGPVTKCIWACGQILAYALRPCMIKPFGACQHVCAIACSKGVREIRVYTCVIRSGRACA
eukprot:2451748-Pleurochrysis_carterae.AAC.1